jgi:endonuclease/exonuclease/phosphatase (EEP) superfamily protein YafD
MALERSERPIPPWRRWRTPVALVIPLWLIIIALAFVAALRLFAWDEIALFAILNTITIFFYLPAWPIAIVAVLGHRPALAGSAFVICILQITFLAPELAATQPLPAWTDTAPTFRLLDGNVYNSNESMAGYIRQIETERPQLVTFEESIPRDVHQLRQSGALAGLPHQFEVYGTDPFVFLIASRYPLRGTHVIYLYGRPLIVETTLVLPSGPQPLWALHTIAPLPVSFEQWRGQLSTIARLVRARGTNRLLVAGDFNATWGSKGFRSILDTGMTDAAAARGHALEMTWSQEMPPLPPFTRIDHILTGPGVEVVRYATQDGPGSDHRDLIATVAVRPY